MMLCGYILSDEDAEEESFLEDWEDEDGDEDYEVLVDSPTHVKKKSKFGLVFVLIIILLGVGGFFYYIGTPQGESLRSKMPASILNMLPFQEQKQQQHSQQKPVNLDDNTIIPNDFSAPPMPNLDEEFDDAPLDFAFASPTPSASEGEVDNLVDSGSDMSSDLDVLDVSGQDINLQGSVDTNIEVTELKSDNVKSEIVVDLEDRISTLEKAVLNIENNMVRKGDIDSINKKIKLEIQSLRKDSGSTKAFKKKQVVAKSYGSKSPKKVVGSHKTDTKQIKKIEWVLRSAQPGTAWISEIGKDGRKKVSVGDRVTGLGTIKAIEQDKDTGHWVVRGSDASVNQ